VLVKEDQLRYKAIIFDLFGTLIDNFSVNEYKKMSSDMAAILGIDPEIFMYEWWATFDLRALGKLKEPEENIEYIFEKIGKEADKYKIKKAAKIKVYFDK